MAEKWLVIDSHTHYHPMEEVVKAVSSGVASPPDWKDNQLKMAVAVEKMGDIEGTLRLMEDAGVDMVVFNQASSSEQGMGMSKAVNNGYARIARQYPGKFILCGHVPLQAGQDVVDEVERCINELGLHGMALAASFADVKLDSRILWPIYEKINQLDVPIVVHPPMRLLEGERGSKYELSSTVLRESDIAAAAVEVMYGVLKDFPDLKFLMPHYGGAMPGQKARIRAWFEPEGWDVPDDIKYLPKTPQELDELGLSKAFDELFDKLYFDMAGSGAGWIPMMEAALLTIRTDRICFGTDYPFDIHDARGVRAFIDNIKKLDIPDADKRLMLGENIKKLFKI